MASDFSSWLKGLQTTFSNYNPENEPLSDLQQLAQLVQDLRSGHLESEKVEPLFGALGQLLNTLLTSYRMGSEASAEVVIGLLRDLLLAVPHAWTSDKFMEAVRISIDSDKPFYKTLLQDVRDLSFPIPPTPQPDNFAEWRISLQVKDKIDAIKFDTKYGVKGWAVAFITEQDDQFIKIAFEGEGSYFDRTLSKNSEQIAPHGTYSSDQEWRVQLTRDSLIDANDTEKLWYNSTILNIRQVENDNGGITVEARVAYRVYEPSGEKFDEIGNFRGWSSKFDEWVSIRSPRLAPYNKFARRWPIPPEQQTEEAEISDSNDYLFCPNWAFAVTRPGCASQVLISNLNNFGLEGGYKFILDRIRDPATTFEQIFSLVKLVGRQYSILHAQFAKNYVLELKDAVFSYFLNAPEALVRTWSKDKLEVIYDCLSRLLKRAYTIKQKNEIMDDFIFKLAIKCFNSPYLDKRIQGLKSILNIVRTTRLQANSSSKALEVATVLADEGILLKAYGAKGHPQLIQRTAEIIRLLSSEMKLLPDMLEVIWQASDHFDEEKKVATYKILGEVANSFKPDILEFFVDKVIALPDNRLGKAELDLMFDLVKYPLRCGTPETKAVEFLWELITGDKQISSTIQQLSVEHFCNLLKCWEMRRLRFDVLAKSIKKLRVHSAAIQCLRIMLRILDSYPTTASQTEPYTKRAMTDILIKNQHILEAYFDNFDYFKGQAQSGSSGLTDRQISDLNVIERFTYSSQIEERLHFLQVIMTESSYTLSSNQMDWLWDTLYTRALCSGERNVFLKWLKKVTESQSEGSIIFDDSGVHSFFHEKIANTSNDFTNLTPEGFSVFRSYFLLDNASQKMLQRIGQSSYSTYSTSYSEFAAPDFEYEVLVKPLDLEGMTVLRQLLLTAQDFDVFTQAKDLTNALYENLSNELAEEAAEINLEYLHYCLNLLKTAGEDYMHRALLLMNSFIEILEKRGNGGLKSHSAMLKGEMHVLTVTNSIYYSVPCPEIPKKLEVKCFSNTTIWELRKLISRQVKVLPDSFKLVRNSPFGEVKEICNGKTLSELRLRSSESFNIMRKVHSPQRVALIDSKNQLVTKAKAIFSTWFHKFADKGDKMSAEGLAAFTSSCTSDKCKATDPRIKEVLETYDADHDGLMTEEDFHEFYRLACISRLGAVWSNLSAHHYRYDLKTYTDIDTESVDPETMPGYLLSKDQGNYDTLFNALNSPKTAEFAWKLIIRLPTNPEIQHQIYSLNPEVWHYFDISHSVYKLVYCLEILESLLEDSQDLDEASLQLRREWKIKFIRQGGFEHLYNLFNNLDQSSDIFVKNCLASVLSILGVFILAAFSATSPDVFEAVQNLRKSSSIFEAEEEPLAASPVKALPEDKHDIGELSLIDLLDEPQLKRTTSIVKEEEVENTVKYTDTRSFKELVSDLIEYTDLSNLIMQHNFGTVINKLLHLVHKTLLMLSFENEDKRIINSALALWVSSVLHDHCLIEHFYSFEHNESMTWLGLTCPKGIQIRKTFSSSIAVICAKVTDFANPPAQFFLSSLLKNLPKGAVSTQEADVAQFFETLTYLIEMDAAKPTHDYKVMLNDFVRAFRDHPYVEKRIMSPADKVLVGLLQVSETIVKQFPDLKEGFRDLLTLILKEMLFPDFREFSSVSYNPEDPLWPVNNEPPKCKTRESRSAAYKLLTTLSEGHAGNFDDLLQQLNRLKSQIKPTISWAHSPSSTIRSVAGYSGIRNLGNICYMNSMLQQFYMVPQLRYNVLATDDGKEPTNAAYLRGDPEVDVTKPGVEVDENVLHQIQNMFGFLELSERQAFNPAHFCYAFKDFSGNPTNLRMQADAQEFLNMLIDRLETGLKETSSKHLMQNVFGGKTVSQMICKECKNVVERVEDFCNISVDVKNSKTLYESMEKYIAGDTISDYTCDKCQKKVDITKRTCLAELPNYLIVHLQRIVFDFDSFVNMKINSRLEFPRTFNVEPYTKAGLERKERGEEAEPNLEPYDYELVGVVVHTGTAESGHYYSYIQHRQPDGTHDPEKWFEFNDSFVRTFSPQSLERECFGGTQESDEVTMVSWLKSFKENSRNAYMLFYERKVKTPLVTLAGDSTTSPREETRDFNTLVKRIPDSVYQNVLGDNDLFMFERHIYSAEFFRFATDLIKTADFDLSLWGMQLAFDIVAHASEGKILPELLDILKTQFTHFPQNCSYFLEYLLANDAKQLSEVMLVCSDKLIRGAAGKFIAQIHAIEASHNFGEGSVARKFIDACLLIVPTDCEKHWTRFPQYWEMIGDIARSGKAQLEYLYEIDAIARLLDFYLADKSPLAKPGEKRKSLGSKNWLPQFTPLIEAVTVMIQGAETYYRPGEVKLSDSAKLILYDPVFYNKTLKENHGGKALGQSIAHLCYEDLNFSLLISQVILQGLNEIDYEDVRSFYEVLEEFLTVPDSLTRQRIEWMLGFPMMIKVRLSDSPFPQFGAASIQAIDEEVFSYITTLHFKDQTDSILSLIWRHSKLWEYFCLMNLRHLLNLCLKSPVLLTYITSLPGPTYQFARYTDWVDHFIENYRRGWVYSTSSTAEDIEEEAQKLLAKFRAATGHMTSEAYVIGSSLNETVKFEDSRDGITLRVYEYTVKYAPSQPNGHTNGALPNKLLRSELVKQWNTKPSILVNTQTDDFKSNNDKAGKVSFGTGMRDAEEACEDSDDDNAPKPTTVSNDVIIEEPARADEDALPFEDSMVLRIEAENLNPFKAKLTVQLSTDEGPNYLYPVTEISSEVPENSLKDVFNVVKLQPAKPWGGFRISWTAKFSIRKVEPAPEVTLVPTNVDAPEGQKSCPECTFFNPIEAYFCDACDHTFS
mmetsp:Transcript_7871/g.15214  ORF Transcript_7871/g.15214 Transcript_7871/m.15214 type:complete len:2832 (+) Transcript_7871:1305-9800(+)